MELIYLFLLFFNLVSSIPQQIPSETESICGIRNENGVDKKIDNLLPTETQVFKV